MELKYKFVLFICLAVIVVFLVSYFFAKSGRKEFSEGKKVVGTFYAKETPYIKRRIIQYKLCKTLLVIVSIFCLCVSSFMLAGPYKNEFAEKESYNRDIILCIDVSFSVLKLDYKIVNSLKQVIENLKGDRFGIVVFNSSPVLVSPLTDDYEYVLEQLDLIEKGLLVNLDEMELEELRNEGLDINTDDDLDLNEWYYYSGYITAGTTVGAEERGSSLIGDGLAASVFDFPEAKEGEDERTKLIIFASDNELAGDPIVSLSEAADICVENNVKVYGIGTKEMQAEDMREMKKAVEKTGGNFYLEEEKETISDVVKNIEKETKSVLRNDIEVQEIDIVFAPFILLILGVSCLFVLKKVTKGR